MKKPDDNKPMVTWCIQARCMDLYEKFVEAKTRNEALKAIQGENWDDPEKGWEHIDGESEIEWCEKAIAKP